MFLASWLGRSPRRPANRPAPAGRPARPRVDRLEDRAAPAVLTVNTLADDTDADAVLSVREAATLVASGTTDPGGNGLGRPLTAGEAAQVSGTLGVGDTIRFESAPGVPLAGTIALADELGFGTAVDVVGPGARTLTLSGQGQTQVLRLGTGFRGTVSGLRLADGPSLPFQGDSVVDNAGTLSLVACEVADAPNARYGVQNDAGAVLTMDGVTVRNVATGLENLGTATLVNCTITNCTNGGIFHRALEGELVVRHSTIAGNTMSKFLTSGFGAAGVQVGQSADANVTPARLEHTVVAGNIRRVYDQSAPGFSRLEPGDAAGAFVASRFNLIGANGGITAGLADGVDGNRVGTIAAPIDAKLLPPANNGGPTDTRLPAADSPLVNAGDPAFAPPPAADQRGLPRVSGGRIDIGAVELQTALPPGQFRFSAAAYAVGEADGRVVITVERVNGSAGAVTVQYATSAGTATPGADYTAVSGTLAWADGDAAPKTFEVPITDDAADEPDETVSLSLLGPTGGATVGSPGAAALTIADNDLPPPPPPPGEFRFSAAAYAVGEGAGRRVITVERVNGSAGAVSVRFATAAGTATAGADYSDVTGTLAWADGDAAPKTFEVPVLDDGADEPDETVTLTLSAPAGGATVGSPGAATLTVLDNDSPPTVSDVPDVVVAAGGTAGPLGFTVADAETPAGALDVTAVSSDPGLTPTVTLGGGDGSRTVTVTGAAGRTGSAVITLTVTDTGGLTATDTFVVTFLPPGSANTPPTISDVPDVGTPAGRPVSVEFTVGDAETPADALRVEVAVSDLALFPADGQALTGSGAARALTLTPAAGRPGSAVVTLTVTDADGLTATDKFTVSVFQGGGGTLVVENTPPTPPPFVRLFAVGAGLTGGPRVKVFNDDGTLRFDFFAFEDTLRTGVFVATADVDGDRVEDVVVGVGGGVGGEGYIGEPKQEAGKMAIPGTTPRVRVFSGKTGALLAEVMAYEDKMWHGVEVAAGDIDGDGSAEVFAAPRPGGDPRIRSFQFKGGSLVPGPLDSFYALSGEGSGTGAVVAVADLDGDGKGEVIVGERGMRRVQVFGADGQERASFAPVAVAPLDVGGLVGLVLAAVQAGTADPAIVVRGFDQKGAPTGLEFAPFGDLAPVNGSAPGVTVAGGDFAGRAAILAGTAADDPGLTALTESVPNPHRVPRGGTYGDYLADLISSGPDLVGRVFVPEYTVHLVQTTSDDPDKPLVIDPAFWYREYAREETKVSFAHDRPVPSRVRLFAPDGKQVLDLTDLFEQAFVGGVRVG